VIVVQQSPITVSITIFPRVDPDGALGHIRAVAQQRAIVVLGAGRSGTSAITRAVQAVGVELGDNLRPGGGKNPTGFFEDQDLLAVNKRLKRLLDIRGDSVRLIDDQEWQAPAVRSLQSEAVDLIRRRFGGYPIWGYKYARTLRLLPFWLDVYRELDLDVGYVMPLRNPISVARSRDKLDPRRGTQEKSDLEWIVNVVPYFRLVRGRPLVVVDYDLLMASPAAQLERMAMALSLPLTDSVRASIDEYVTRFLRSDMRHSRFSLADIEADGTVNTLVRRGYPLLYKLAVDELAPDAPEFWDGWREVETRTAELAPALRHIDRVENDLRRAQRNLLGPLQLAPMVWRKLRGA
jgi:hypothetical protein